MSEKVSENTSASGVGSKDLLGDLFEDAIESLRKARRHVTDEEGKQLLYHAGMTIRTLQQRYDLSERS